MISLIVAHDKNRGIGYKNTIPWHIPSDFAHFKRTTLEHPIIMGRKTFESIGKPLPKRTNIVVTRNDAYTRDSVVVKHSLKSALDKASSLNDEVFVIGGSTLYEQALPSAHRLYVTEIDHAFTVDSYFPPYPEFTNIIHTETLPHDTYHVAMTIRERP